MTPDPDAALVAAALDHNATKKDLSAARDALQRLVLRLGAASEPNAQARWLAGHVPAWHAGAEWMPERAAEVATREQHFHLARAIRALPTKPEGGA